MFNLPNTKYPQWRFLIASLALLPILQACQPNQSEGNPAQVAEQNPSAQTINSPDIVDLDKINKILENCPLPNENPKPLGKGNYNIIQIDQSIACIPDEGHIVFRESLKFTIPNAKLKIDPDDQSKSIILTLSDGSKITIQHNFHCGIADAVKITQVGNDVFIETDKGSQLIDGNCVSNMPYSFIDFEIWKEGKASI